MAHHHKWKHTQSCSVHVRYISRCMRIRFSQTKNPWNGITTRDFVVRQNVSLWLLDEKVFNICSSKANVHVLVSKRALGENTVLLFRYFKDYLTEKTLHFPTLAKVRTRTHGKHTHFRLNKNKPTSSAFFWTREGFYTGQWSSGHRLR